MKILAFALAALLLNPLLAHAQTAASGSQSGSAAQAASLAGAGATSNSNINIVQEAAQQLPSTTLHYDQSGKINIANVPQVTVTGPASGPCTGRSGGVGVAGVGFGVGANYAEIDTSCTLRENARVLAMIIPATAMGPARTALEAMLVKTLVALVNYTPETRDSEPAPAPKTAAITPDAKPVAVAQYVIRD